MCKIVQRGDWSGYVDCKSVPMLTSKNKATKVLDVKTVTHNSQKRKLVLLEDRTVYKIKKIETGRSCLTRINIAVNLLCNVCQCIMSCTYCIYK